MPDALLLEWEGVIAETSDARRDAMLGALAEEEVFLDAGAYAVLCDGRSVQSGAEEVLAHVGRTDPTLADLVALRATRAFAERLGKGFVLLPGVREFIARAQLSAPVGLVTTATRSETDFVLRLADLDGAIATVVSADDSLHAMPHAGAYHQALDSLARRRSVKRERSIAIAPGVPALRASRAAGLRTIALGAPAHVAIEADAAIGQLDGMSVGELARLVGIAPAERPS